MNNKNGTLPMVHHESTSVRCEKKPTPKIFTSYLTLQTPIAMSSSSASCCYSQSYQEAWFPFKLHRMLEAAIQEGNEAIVSWQPHGRAFKIHEPQGFEDLVLPKFYSKVKYKSFLRQLQLYGFQRNVDKASVDFGAYSHDLFQKGKEYLCHNMKRPKIKKKGPRATVPRLDAKETPQDEQLCYIEEGMYDLLEPKPIGKTLELINYSRPMDWVGFACSEILKEDKFGCGYGQTGITAATLCSILLPPTQERVDKT